MYDFTIDTTGVRMTAKVEWEERPWGEGGFSSSKDPERYAIFREFEIDAASLSVEAFKRRWGIISIERLVVGVPGINRLTGEIFTCGTV